MTGRQKTLLVGVGLGIGLVSLLAYSGQAPGVVRTIAPNTSPTSGESTKRWWQFWK